jgi:hypothetical protein
MGNLLSVDVSIDRRGQVSGSEITTNVPTGAGTGYVEVITPNGTLSSNVPFMVP